MVSILILTKDEEVNIERCIRSVDWCDDVVVFDSYSTDRTVELARSLGARVESRVFDHYAAQRNAALALEYKYEWILMVDADECVSPELKEEMFQCLEHAPEDLVMLRMRRKDYFFGRWIRHSSGYPTWFGRLVRKGRVRVEREINEEYIADGEIRELEAHLIHYPFAKGIAYWFERHNRYSSMEAVALVGEVQEEFSMGMLFSRDAVLRRKALKQLAYRMPGRPLLVFVYLYFFRMGFLDGAAGLRYTLMRSMYEFMIDLKVKEIRAKNRGEEAQR
ncbi:glycosyltransferase family 2 protein [Pontiella sp.]|uniref:glycosyltransferase family 2 protein n=1 Tax=Pontiella sp. TaxID=2837462 RepID=UPI0035666B49